MNPFLHAVDRLFHKTNICCSDEDSFRPVAIDIDIGLSAHANAKRYFSQKKHASQKERKTVDASAKALKSAERKTKQVLKEMKVTANIVKARKVCDYK